MTVQRHCETRKKPRDSIVDEQKADALKTRIDEINRQDSELNSKLAVRSEDFQKQVANVLGDRILADGEQVLNAEWRDALLVEIPAAVLPEGTRLEQVVADLRKELPDVIDLRPEKQKRGYGIAVSILVPPGGNDENVVHDLQAAIERIAAKRYPGLLAPNAVVSTRNRRNQFGHEFDDYRRAA